MGLLIDLYKLKITGKNQLYLLQFAARTIFYPRNAMWFLWASILGALILGFIYCKFSNWKLVWITYSCVSYCILLLCNNYYFLVEDTFMGTIVVKYLHYFASARNGIFLAPVYMGFGFLIQSICQKFGDRIKSKKNQYISILMVFIGFLLLYLEAKNLYGLTGIDDEGFFLAQLILIPSLVFTAIIYNINSFLPFYNLRRLSTSIYYMHGTIIALLELFLPQIKNPWTIFIITLSIAIFIALVSYRMNNKYLKSVLG